MKRLLVIDNERDIAELMQYALQQEGYYTDVAFSTEEALRKRLDPYDLVLLNLTKGDNSGMGFTKTMKSMPQTANIPIIYITTPNGEEDSAKSFGLNPDECITKPLFLKEVKTKVRAVFRRMEIAKAGQITPEDLLHFIEFEGLHIDMKTKQLTVDGKPVQVTYLELELLSFLIKHKGQVFSRNELINKIWPEDTIVLERTVDVNITRIRKKIEPYGKHIKTRFGYGYYFV